jgi:hypothetical protein
MIHRETGQPIAEVRTTMSRRNDSSKMSGRDTPKTRPDTFNNPEMNRKAAEAAIPEGPSKNQDKRAGGFSRSN